MNVAEDCDLHSVLRLPRGTFTPYSQGVKANAIFFTTAVDELNRVLALLENIDGTLSFDDLQYIPTRRIDRVQYLQTGDVIAMSSGSKAVVGKAASVENPQRAATETQFRFCRRDEHQQPQATPF